MGSPPQAEDAVLGHYSVVGASGLLQPLLSESSSLFVAVVEDNAAAVQSALTTEAARGMHNVLYWTSVEEQPSAAATEEPASSGQPRPSVSVKQRSLLMLAAYHAVGSGNLGVLKLLLSTPGVDPRQQAADNVSALTVSAAFQGLGSRIRFSPNPTQKASYGLHEAYHTVLSVFCVQMAKQAGGQHEAVSMRPFPHACGQKSGHGIGDTRMARHGANSNACSHGSRVYACRRVAGFGHSRGAKLAALALAGKCWGD